MDQRRLGILLEQSEVQRRIIGVYAGAYSIGVITHPTDGARLAIRVRIEGNDDSLIAKSIDLDGETIPILVTTGWQPPEPLAAA